MSDVDECDPTEMTREAAMDCPISTKTICSLTKNCISLETDGVHGPMGHGTDLLEIDANDLMRQVHFMRNLDVAFAALKEKNAIRIKDNDRVNITTDTYEGKPVFLFAVTMVLIAHVTGRDLVVWVPAHQMGIPGTSLTLRPGCVLSHIQ